jgi:mono/diheme cytochrome c family protein
VIRTRAVRLLAVLVLAATAACRQDMHDQPKYKPQRASAFFPDGRASRPLVDGTVAWGQLAEEQADRAGKVKGAYVREPPVPLTRALLLRGRERFDVFCSPCHDRAGTGDGMIVQRGFRRPPSLHAERLRQQPDGYLFDVITNGFGVMPSYAAQIPAADRWAIIAYVRALQLSQGATLADVPAAERRQLEARD